MGGIQSYLWELWRRLPPSDFAVLTTPYPGAGEFDRAQAFAVVRTTEPVLLPNPILARRIRSLADRTGAELVVLDPALPLGLVGPHLGIPYAVVLHGAEVTVPGRLPPTRPLMARVLRRADLVISAGGYPEAEARRAAGDLPPVVSVPPGVDVERFRSLSAPEKVQTRRRLGLPSAGPLVVSVSRLVPRKGMDVLIEAVGALAGSVSTSGGAGVSGRQPALTLAIGGSGRDRGRLERLAGRTRAPVRFLGRVPDADLPALYACADVFALCCRSRWAGLEQEGFGIVFLEAAAAGVPAVAGESGGAAEAVGDGESGLVVRDPSDAAAVASAIDAILSDPERAGRMGAEGRRRAEQQFSYDRLARRLMTALDGARRPSL